MTQKKRRMRGTRTHGGGSQKNRRGAGNRGGRGGAGRKGHEMHGTEPLGKRGFKPPGDDIEKKEVNIKDIDMMIYEASIELESNNDSDVHRRDDSQSNTTAADGGTMVQAHEGIELGHADSRSRVDLTRVYPEADIVKLLGSGSLHQPTEIIVDDCSDSAKRIVKAQGGWVYFAQNKLAQRTQLETVIGKRYKKNNTNNGDHNVDLEKYLNRVDDGESLQPEEFEEVLRHADKDIGLSYDIMREQAMLVDDPGGLEVVLIMGARDFAREHELDTSPFETVLESYFEDLHLPSGFRKSMVDGLPDSMTIDDVLKGLEHIQDAYRSEGYESQPELREDRIREDEREYLFAVDKAIERI